MENGHPNQQINCDLTKTGHGGSMGSDLTAPKSLRGAKRHGAFPYREGAWGLKRSESGETA